jgi:hypothetical protein
VRSEPLHDAEEVRAMIEQANLARKDAWRDMLLKYTGYLMMEAMEVLDK